MQVVLLPFAESVAAELASFGQNIITARQLGVEAEALDSALDNAELPLLIVESLGGDEGEVEVTVVVIDGAATGATSHEVAAVGLEGVDVHLAVWVLVLPDDNSAAVAPEV